MASPVPSENSPEPDQAREDLETSVAVVNLDTMEAIMEEFASFTTDTGVALRSHVKIHKVPEIACRQEALPGAGGIVCQTLREAEVMARNGLSDIYLSYMVVSESKLDRLVTLLETIDSFATTIDCPGNVEALQDTGARHGSSIDTILEVNVGLGRVGAKPGEPALKLARTIVRCENLAFADNMAYEGHINAEATSEADYERRCREAIDTVQTVVELLEENGITVDEVKVGSTGTARYSGTHPVVTEINPGMFHSTM